MVDKNPAFKGVDWSLRPLIPHNPLYRELLRLCQSMQQLRSIACACDSREIWTLVPWQPKMRIFFDTIRILTVGLVQPDVTTASTKKETSPKCGTSGSNFLAHDVQFNLYMAKDSKQRNQELHRVCKLSLQVM